MRRLASEHSERVDTQVASVGDRVARRRSIVGFAATMSLVALSLLPMLASGFYGDDEANSLITATLLAMNHQTLLGVMMRGIINWVTSVGRFFPLSEYVRILFWLVNGNALAYKIVLMALVLLNAALLYALVRRLARSTGLAAVAVLAFSTALQFRYYDEPILSYAGLLPIITALVLTALLCFLGYLDSGRRRLLVLSALAFAVSLLIYEVALPMCLVFVAVALVYPVRSSFAKAIRASWAYLVAAGIAVGIVLTLRLVLHFQPVTPEQMSGYQLSLSPAPVVTTMLKQMVAALPLTYYASRMSAALLGLTSRPLYDSPLAYLSAHPYTTALSAAVFFSVGLYVLWSFLTREDRTSASGSSALMIIGLGFLVLPNLLVSLAAKHQQGVGWGEGYLPVYMSAVGVALLVAWMVDRVRTSGLTWRWLRAIAIAMALVIGFVGAVNFDSNRVTVEALNRTRSYPEDVVAQALSRGLLTSVPDGAWLSSNIATAWQYGDFYKRYAGRTLTGVVPLVGADSLARLPLLENPHPSSESTSYVADPSGPPIFYLYVENSTRDAGYILLSRLDSANETSKGISISGTPLLAYRTWPKPPSYDWQQVRGWPARHASYEPTSAFGPALPESTVLSSGGDWVLQRVPAGWTVKQVGLDIRNGRSWLDDPGPEWSRAR